MNKQTFFETAFSRNIGLLSKEEAAKLMHSQVAIAGLGGVGASYALTLARMGFGKFVICDFDTYELANFNRQAGANMTTLNKPKIDGVRKMLLEINPHLEITCLHEGLTPKNIESFLANSDVVLDAIDFFAIDAHRLLHRESRKMGKSVLFSVPAGFSGTLQVFGPNHMSFDSYFDFKDNDDNLTQICKFALGMAPKSTHSTYLEFDPQTLIAGRPTSIASACSISTGLVCTNAAMLALGRFNEAHYAPFFIQIDSFSFSCQSGKLMFGNRGLFQKLKIAIFKAKLGQWKSQFNQTRLANP